MSKHFAIITGPIASGKSTLAQHFQALGVAVVDVDTVARHLQEKGSAVWEQLRLLLSEDYFDSEGTLDRARLRELITVSTYFRRQVENIVHPPVRAAAKKEIALATSSYAVITIPLVFSLEEWQGAHSIILAKTDSKTRKERLMNRDAISKETAQALMDTQRPLEDYAALCTTEIDTTDGDTLAARVASCHQQILSAIN